MTRTIAIVPAAGAGKRLGFKVPKPFVLLRGKPLVAHTLKALSSCGAIDAIVVAAERPAIGRMKGVIKRFGLYKVIDVVAGGKTRSDSVRNCLKRIGPLAFDIVLIHDGARPLVEGALIERAVKAAQRFGACVVAAPESDTVKVVGSNGFVKKTLDRNTLFRTETPQAFKVRLIKKAYGVKRTSTSTDDASLVERLGVKVKVIVGPPGNIKVTTKEDLKLAEVLL